MGTRGLKSTAIATNPLAQKYLLARTACVTTRRPDTQTTISNNTWKLSLGSRNTARSNTATDTHFMIFVSTANLVSSRIWILLSRSRERADLAAPAERKNCRLHAARRAAILWKVELETS